VSRTPPLFRPEHQRPALAYDLTLRDYFAIRSFQTRLAKHQDWTLTELTDQAYIDADAMLDARKTA